MASHLTPLGTVWKILDECAPGYSKKASSEYWRIRWNTLTYSRLPVGPHGSKSDRTQVFTGHVRALVRHFGIEECAAPYL